MLSFSIDQVSGPFKADVEGGLSRIEQAGQALAASPVLNVSADFPATPEGVPLFDEIGNAGHHIHGASSLLSVKSLAQSARLLEVLSQAGQECALRVASDLRDCRALSAFCADATRTIRQMLEHELAHNSAEAEALAEQLRNSAAPFEKFLGSLTNVNMKAVKDSQTEPGTAAIPPLPVDTNSAPPAFAFVAPVSEAPVTPEAPVAFSFQQPENTTPVDAPSLTPVTSEPQETPAPAFQFSVAPSEEPPPAAAAAQEVAPAFQFSPTPAENAPPIGDLAVLPSQEPASAPVVDAQQAPDTPAFSFAAPQSPAPIDPQPAAEAGTSPQFEFAAPQPPQQQPAFAFAAPSEAPADAQDAPPAPQDSPSLPAAEPAAEAISQELLECFLEESKALVASLRVHLAALAGGQRDHATLKELERAYHTLKGSAAIVGMKAVGDQAYVLQRRMEDAVETPGLVTSAFVEQLIADTERLFAELKQPPLNILLPLPSRPEVVEPKKDPATLSAIFRKEAAIVCEQIAALLGRLRHEHGDLALRELGQAFHHLKGSAAICGHEVEAEAARLQALCNSGGDVSVIVQEAEAALRTLSLKMLGREVTVLEPAAPILEPLPPAEFKFSAPAPQTTPQAELADSEAGDAELRAVFRAEAQELLEDIDRSALKLEEAQQPRETLSAIFRAYHTLKGSANTVGLRRLGQSVHEVENLLEAVRSKSELPPLRKIVSLVMKFQRFLRGEMGEAVEHPIDFNEIEASIRELSADSPESPREHPAPAAPRHTRTTTTLGGHDPAERHFIRIATDRLEGLMNLTGELVINRSRLSRQAGVLRAIVRELSLSRNRLLTTVDHFRERYEFNVEDSQKGIPRGPLLHPLAPNGGGFNRLSNVSNGGNGGNGVEHGDADPSLLQLFSDIEMDRYDDMNILSRSLNEIGNDIAELQTQMKGALDTFTHDADSFSGVIAGLQTEITRVRMVPVEQLFLRLRAAAQDAAEHEKKTVLCVAEGEDVNLDKTIVDELANPLLHLVRNAVAHGIEDAAQRQAAGKDPLGTIRMSARQDSGHLILEVRDDGAGLNLARLREIGIQRGLLSPDTPLSDPQVREMVFVPGLSTREVADDVSGRGVGCDVVRRAIEKLNGRITVSTEPGKGTLFTISMPLTLAICRALIVEHHGQLFAVPLNFSERVLDLAEHPVIDSAGDKRIKVQGAYMLMHSLNQAFGWPDASPHTSGAQGSAIILKTSDQRVIVRVDSVRGQDEIVVKRLGEVFAENPLFSGVAINSDGKLILIVDVMSLLQAFKSGEPAGAQPEKAELRAAAPAHAGAVPAPGKPRVLFVDDSLSVRKVAEKLLTELGAEVTLAVDGLDAMQKLRQQPIDMVFTDLEMPRMHGYELIREMRFIPAYRDVPIVVATSRSGEKHRAQAEALGAAGYITKPFTIETLRMHLNAAMSRRRAK